MRKAGILGGTFDPIHTGHLIMAENAREEAGLEQVLFVPARKPPHKLDQSICDVKHRLEMVRLATQNNPFFEVSEIESARPEASYSVDTVKQLKKANPGTEFYFIIGGDSLLELHTWREPERLVQLCEFVVAIRPEDDLERIKGSGLGLSSEAVEKLTRHVITSNPIGISASQIRNRVAQGRSIKYLVPAEVEQYIKEHNLYNPNL